MVNLNQFEQTFLKCCVHLHLPDKYHRMTVGQLLLLGSNHQAVSLGCKNASDFECLQQFDPGFLIEHATISKISRKKRWFFSAALPVDGNFPLSQIARGAWNRVPLIVGISSCEACKIATVGSGPVGTNLTREEFREDMSRFGFSGRRGAYFDPPGLIGKFWQVVLEWMNGCNM